MFHTGGSSTSNSLPYADNGAGVRGKGMKVKEPPLRVNFCRLNDSPVTNTTWSYTEPLTMAGHLALIGQHSLRSLHNSRKEKKKLAFFILLSDGDYVLPAAVFEVCICSCKRTYESYKDN